MSHILEMAKIPTTRDNYIGVELEFLLEASNLEKLNAALVKAGVEYNVHVGRDGSVKDLEWVPKYNTIVNTWNGLPDRVLINRLEKKLGMEIRILATEKELAQVVQKVCKVIWTMKGQVNRTCGMHVHLDMRNRKFDDVFNNFFFAQKLLFKTQPKSRLSGKYSKLIPSIKSRISSRYYGVNKMSYEKHNTLELRMHEGSVDEKEILVWVGTLIKIANLKTQLEKDIKDFSELELPQKVQDYFQDRIKKYKKQA